MNILLSSGTHAWNAEAEYAALLGEELLAAGHHVWMWARPETGNARELQRRGLPVYPDIPDTPSPLAWWGAWRRLRAFQARHAIEVVDVFRSSEFPLHLLAARGGGGPRVIRTRGIARPVRRSWFNRRMHRDWGDAVIASSGVVQSQLCEGLGLEPAAVPVIYFPADPPPRQSAAERRAGKRRLLAEMGVRGERLLLGIVGRLDPVKGHARLLTAMEEVVRAHPAVLLAIFAKSGKGEDLERPALERQVREAGLAPYVRLLGFREDIRAAMGWLDLGVVPSLGSEVNCRVTMEFFSAGTPVVAFPSGALPEVVEEGVSGLVTPGHDPAGLAAALLRLAGDAPLRRRLAAGARERATHRFSRRRFAEETLRVFRQALERERR